MVLKGDNGWYVEVNLRCHDDCHPENCWAMDTNVVDRAAARKQVEEWWDHMTKIFDTHGML